MSNFLLSNYNRFITGQDFGYSLGVALADNMVDTQRMDGDVAEFGQVFDIVGHNHFIEDSVENINGTGDKLDIVDNGLVLNALL